MSSDRGPQLTFCLPTLSDAGRSGQRLSASRSLDPSPAPGSEQRKERNPGCLCMASAPGLGNTTGAMGLPLGNLPSSYIIQKERKTKKAPEALVINWPISPLWTFIYWTQALGTERLIAHLPSDRRQCRSPVRLWTQPSQSTPHILFQTLRAWSTGWARRYLFRARFAMGVLWQHSLIPLPLQALGPAFLADEESSPLNSELSPPLIWGNTQRLYLKGRQEEGLWRYLPFRHTVIPPPSISQTYHLRHIISDILSERIWSRQREREACSLVPKSLLALSMGWEDEGDGQEESLRKEQEVEPAGSES